MRRYGELERLEAALAALSQGIAHPATPDFAPAVLSQLERSADLPPRRGAVMAAPRHRLIVVVAIGLALLAVAAAAAYYVSVRTWLSAGPRGVQFTNDFGLVELFRAEPQAEYHELTVDSAGDRAVAVRLYHANFSREDPELDQAQSGIVEISGLREENAQASVLVTPGALKDPALWDPGIDLSGFVFPECCGLPANRLSAASNGDLFFLATASAATTFQQFFGSPPSGTSLIVRHADGALQKVLTVRELVDAGLLPEAASNQRVETALAASAPDRLWLLVNPPSVPVAAGEPVFRGIYEVTDPNGDGNWSDRTIAALSLPPSAGVEGARAGEGWFLPRVAAEPSVGDEDRSRSFLLEMQSYAGELRIYRVSDYDNNGDALGTGEFELLFSGVPSSQDADHALASRTVTNDAKIALKELIVSSFTTQTRVSRITETGEVIDIARAFSSIDAVGADTDGNIYAWAMPPDGSDASVLYRLKPQDASASAGIPAGDAAAAASPQSTTEAITPGVPRIAFGKQVAGPGERGSSEISLVGADGTGLSRLVPGEHNFLGTRSPRGSRMVYWSDEEVPNEQFTYAANVDGSNPAKLMEKPTDLFCWPSEDSLILNLQDGNSNTPSLYDLTSGRAVKQLEELKDVANVAWPACTAERHQVVFVGGIDFSQRPPAGKERLEVFDLDTGERHELEAPLSDRSYVDLGWSPDGRQLAYIVGPPRFEPRSNTGGPYDLYVRDFPEGQPRLLYHSETGLQTFTWSPSGGLLLVSLASGKACSQEEARARGQDFCDVQRQLILVNVKSGEAAQVVSGEFFFASWSPTDDTLVYATKQGVYLVAPGGEATQLASANGTDCPFCLPASFGWSPDGRYLGVYDVGGTLAVLDKATGATRTLLHEDGAAIWNPQWWSP